MSFWIAAFLLIPLADQAIKALLRQRLGDRVVSLGPLGSVRVIDAPIWWARGGFRPTPVMLWIAWLAGAGALVALATRLPGCEWCAALLLGGSLSHMIETSRRGLRLRLPVPTLLAGIQSSRRRDLDRHRRLHRRGDLRVGRSFALT